MSDYQGTYTTNLNLSKDSVDDSYDVERVNSNSDKIDKWAGEVNTSLNDLANPNLLINSDFQVWQRGESFNKPSYDKYYADRWKLSVYGSQVNPNNYMSIIKRANGMQVNVINTTGGGNIFFQQPLEDTLVNKIKGKKVMLSFKISYSNITRIGVTFNTTTIGLPENVINLDLKNSGTATDIEYVVTFDVPSDISILEPSILVCPAQNKTSSFLLNWVKLELGSKATPFIPRPYGEELALCQRYYEEVPAGQQVLGVKDNVNAFIYWNFIVEKRINPTVSFTHPGYDNNHVNAYSNNIELANTPVEIEWTNKRTARMKIPALSSVPIGSAISAFGAITIDAEIY